MYTHTRTRIYKVHFFRSKRSYFSSTFHQSCTNGSFIWT